MRCYGRFRLPAFARRRLQHTAPSSPPFAPKTPPEITRTKKTMRRAPLLLHPPRPDGRACLLATLAFSSIRSTAINILLHLDLHTPGRRSSSPAPAAEDRPHGEECHCDGDAGDDRADRDVLHFEGGRRLDGGFEAELVGFGGLLMALRRFWRVCSSLMVR